MIPEAYSDLLRKLGEKTARDEVNWQTSTDDTTFIVDFKEFSMAIKYRYSERAPSDVFFMLYDDKGTQIDTFWADESEPPESGWYDFCYDIYSAARRKALRINEAIKTITRQLESTEKVGSSIGEEFVHEDGDVPL